MTDTVELVNKISASMEAMNSNHEKITKELQIAAKSAGDDAKAAIARADELAQKVTAQSSAIVEMEQKLADKVHAAKAPVETLGQMVIKSDAYKAFSAGHTSRARIEANTITGQAGSPVANSDILVDQQRLPGIVPGAFRALRVRDVLPSGVTGSNMIQFTRELAFTNNAAERNENTAKPESALTFELVSVPVQTVAHFIKASKQVLEDAPALQTYIDVRMRFGVDARIDNQLLNGNGTNPNLSGILDSGNHTVFTPETGDNALDSINRAIYNVYASDYAPNAIMLNPADWGAIERLKKGTGDASYIVGDPTGILGPQLWGLPVVVTNNLATGKVIVGAMQMAYQVFNRSGVVVEMFEQDSDNVQKNIVTIRAESRLALATFLPAAVQAGNLTV